MTNDLLKSAVAARGGLARWTQVKSITLEAPVRASLHVRTASTSSSRYEP